MGHHYQHIYIEVIPQRIGGFPHWGRANIPLHTDQDLYNIPDPNQVVGAPKTFRVAITSATECSVLVFFLKFELHQQDHKTQILVTWSRCHDPCLCVLTKTNFWKTHPQFEAVSTNSIAAGARGAEKHSCLLPTLLPSMSPAYRTSDPAPGSCT